MIPFSALPWRIFHKGYVPDRQCALHYWYQILQFFLFYFQMAHKGDVEGRNEALWSFPFWSVLHFSVNLLEVVLHLRVLELFHLPKILKQVQLLNIALQHTNVPTSASNELNTGTPCFTVLHLTAICRQGVFCCCCCCCCFSKTEGSWQPWIEQIYWHHFFQQHLLILFMSHWQFLQYFKLFFHYYSICYGELWSLMLLLQKDYDSGSEA